MKSKRTATLGVVVGALALLAVACGSGKTKAATTSPTLALGAPGSVSSATVSVATSKIGQVLVNGQGMTLYTFDPENSGTIACTAACTPTWPPDLLQSGKPTAGTGVTAVLSTMARPDGGTQVTAAGHPLYTYSGDKAAGDTNGDGIAGKWHVARPDGIPAAFATPGGSTSTTSGYSRY